MKCILLGLTLIFTTSCQAQFYFQLDYTDLSIFFRPTKCIDTLSLTIEKGEYINCTAKIFLEACSGQCKFIVTDKKNKIRLTGFYANAVDTLIKHTYAKTLGKPVGHSYYTVWTFKYLSPLQTGLWIYYDKNGKETYRTEYHYEIYNSNNTKNE